MERLTETLASRATDAAQLLARLSPRQREVLVGMVEGRLNKQIAYHLTLSEKTVKMHRARLLEALGVQTTADAIRIAVEASFASWRPPISCSQHMRMLAA
jgi:DNA-binding NarL/FixJ family response regulator